MKIASLILYLLRVFIPKLNKNPRLKANRKGINWELELSEGIDLSIYVFGCFEMETAKALKKHISSNSCILDIGANIGAHTLPIASLLGEEGKVLAIEPTKFAFDKLKANLKLNKNLSHCVETYQVMLVENDDPNNKTELYSSWPIVKNQQVGSHIAHGGVLKSLEGCSTETLDRFCERLDLSRLDLIKLDVDGAEAYVINGGIKTLRRFHPTIIMEFAPYVYENTAIFLSMVKTLKNLNYQFYYLNGRKIAGQNPKEIHSLVPKGASINIIAI